MFFSELQKGTDTITASILIVTSDVGLHRAFLLGSYSCSSKIFLGNGYTLYAFFHRFSQLGCGFHSKVQLLLDFVDRLMTLVIAQSFSFSSFTCRMCNPSTRLFSLPFFYVQILGKIALI